MSALSSFCCCIFLFRAVSQAHYSTHILYNRHSFHRIASYSILALVRSSSGSLFPKCRSASEGLPLLLIEPVGLRLHLAFNALNAFHDFVSVDVLDEAGDGDLGFQIHI